MQLEHIGLIGYGEVGKTFALGLKDKPGVRTVGAWDLKFIDLARQTGEQAHAAGAGVAAHLSMEALCQCSTLVISAVTASNTLRVAERPCCGAAAVPEHGYAFTESSGAGRRHKEDRTSRAEETSLRQIGCQRLILLARTRNDNDVGIAR